MKQLRIEMWPRKENGTCYTFLSMYNCTHCSFYIIFRSFFFFLFFDDDIALDIDRELSFLRILSILHQRDHQNSIISNIFVVVCFSFCFFHDQHVQAEAVTDYIALVNMAGFFWFSSEFRFRSNT